MAISRSIDYLLFFLLWGVISYNDFKTKKIHNRIIVLGLAVSALLCFLAHGFATFCCQVVLSLAVAMAFWFSGIWPSGDAKLFVLLSSMLVVMTPQSPEALVRLQLTQLINAFIPAAIFYLARNPRIFRSPFAGMRDALSRPLRWDRERRLKTLEEVLYGLFVYGACLLWFRWSALWWSERFVPALLVFWMLSRLLRRFFWKLPQRLLTFSLLVAATFAVLLSQSRIELAVFLRDAGRMFLICVGLHLAMAWTDEAFDYAETYSLRPEGLAPALVLSDSFVRMLRSNPAVSERLGRLYPDGLTADQVRVLRQWCRKEDIASVQLVKTEPFAFWLFAGTLITAATGHNMIALVQAAF